MTDNKMLNSATGTKHVTEKIDVLTNPVYYKDHYNYMSLGSFYPPPGPWWESTVFILVVVALIVAALVYWWGKS